MAHGPKKSQVDEYILERFRMDSYTRTETQLAPEAQRESSPFEMRITTQGKIRNYITYANALLTEKNCQEISLLAMGKAISKAISIAEIIKKRVPGLHQETEIGSTSFTETYTPQVAGLDPVTQTRHVSLIKIVLTVDSEQQQAGQVADNTNGASDGQNRRPRGRGRGGRGARGRGGRGRHVYANVPQQQHYQQNQESDAAPSQPRPPRTHNNNYNNNNGYNNYNNDYAPDSHRGRGGRGGRPRGRGGHGGRGRAPSGPQEQ